MGSSGGSRRAEADATRCPAFTLGGAEAASLCLQGSPAELLCGEERCAGAFWTHGERGDASRLLVSYMPLARKAYPKPRRRGRVIAA